MNSEIRTLIMNQDNNDLLYTGESQPKNQKLYIDPKSDSYCLSTIIPRITSLFCFPCVACCSITHVRPREEVINSYWNVPREILKEPGIYWRNCCGLSQQKISTAIQDIQIKDWKVNDSEGNPLKVSFVVQWRVKDSMKAVFDASNVSTMLQDQALATIRKIASDYPFDSEDINTPCLRKPNVQMANELVADLQSRVNRIGAEILTFSITDTVYTDEVQKMLLATQEAKAHVKAREVVAEGVAGTVLKTVKRLEEDSDIKFNPEEKKQLSTNLLLVLTNHTDGDVNLFINGGGLPTNPTKF